VGCQIWLIGTVVNFVKVWVEVVGPLPSPQGVDIFHTIGGIMIFVG
jgi:hypothetical protein